MGLFRKPSREARTDQINLQGPSPLTSGSILMAYLNDTDPKNKITAIAAAYRCISLISGAIASAPKRVEDIKTGLPRINTYGSKLLNNPSPVQDAHVFWEQMVVSILLSGNAYYLKYRQPGSNQVQRLIWLDPERVTPKAVVDSKEIWIDTLFIYRMKDGSEIPLLADDVLHVSGLSWNGLAGVSVVTAAKRVFESALAADELSARFFQQGTMAGGILTTDRRLEEKSAEALKQRWRAKVQGIGNAFDVLILDQGATYTQLAMSQEDSQFIQQRQFSVAEIGRIFSVPLALLNEPGERPQSVEEAGLNFALYCLEGWASRISSAVSRQLLPGPHQLCISFDKFIRPDARTRSAAAVMWTQTNVMSINELRAIEGLSPLDDPRANDQFYASQAPNVGGAGIGENLAKPEQPIPNGQKPQVDYQQ